MSIGNISGSAINPAVWVGSIVSATMCLEEGETLKYIDYSYIYWIAHLFAGIIAGLWFNIVYGGDEANGIGNNQKQQLISDISDDDNDQ